MRRLLWIGAPALLLSCLPEAQAQLFRKKPTAATAPAGVPELIATLRSDPDGGKREKAAGALRDLGSAAHADVVAALAEAARGDSRVGVRLEAISSLGKMRPVSQDAGRALEEIANHENHLRVRLHASTTLFWYRRAGYASQAPSAEPGSKDGTTGAAPPIELPGVSNGVAGPPLVAPTPNDPAPKAPPAEVFVAPPLIVKPAAETKPAAVPSKLPRGTPFSTAMPQAPIIITRPPDPDDPTPRVAPPPPPPSTSPPPLPTKREF